MRNIIVAFTDHPAAQKIRTILTFNGFSVAGVCTSGAQVLSLTRRLTGGGVIVCASKFHDMTTEFLAEQLSTEYDFLMLVHSNDSAMAEEKGLFSLMLPLKKTDLLDSVNMLLSTRTLTPISFVVTDKINEVKRKDKPGRSPEEKKLIDDAKSVLMERNNMSEEQAHRFLQKRSMDNGSRLIDTAKSVLETYY